MLAETQALTEQATAQLSARLDVGGAAAPVAVWNSLPWTRSEWVADGAGRWLHVAAPPMGYCVVDADGVAPDAETVTATQTLGEA